MRPLLERIHNMEQGSPEWAACRAGKVTGSRLSAVLAKGKSGEAATRRDYRTQLVTEILTGDPTPQGFVSDEMRWGTEQEPYARAAYEVRTGNVVDLVGFVDHPEVYRAGASPDGLVGWDGQGQPAGLLEIKCPKSSTHLTYFLAGVVPEDYKPQMTWEMACVGADWCDFVSYDPRMPEHLQLFVIRYHLDQVYLAQVNREVEAFLAEVQDTLDRLEKLRPPAEPEALERPAPALCGGADLGAGEDPLPL